MKHLFKFIVFLIFISACFSAPTTVKPSFGTIHGSPVVAIIHGNSDVLKDEVQTKDTEDDPLEKFGKIVE